MSETNLDFVCVKQDMTTVFSAESNAGRVCAFSHRSPDKQTLNEDSIAIVELAATHVVCIVADGLGGQPDGDQASAKTVKILVNDLKNQRGSGLDSITLIVGAIERANARLLDISSGSATTLAIAEIDNAQVRTYHVGDSSVLMTGQRGKIKLETIAHSPVGYAVEAGVLDEQESLHHDERHLVSNVVGSAEMHISIGTTLQMQTHDTLLIASDGVFDNLQKDEIIETIRKGRLPDCAELLKDQTCRRMTDQHDPWKPDDYSFILYRSHRV